ncbi:MAG: AMP-binding protein [Candidatus Wallbacteria bacterium]|nr:AMP-binding protein [Candidatus Wallbacteria bacterium]
MSVPSPRTLRELLEELSRVEGRGIVLAGDRAPDERLPWNRFASLAAGTAAALGEAVPPGSTVAAIGDVRLELAVFWACAASGRTAALLPAPSLLIAPAYYRRTVPKMLAALAPAAVVADARSLAKLRELLPAETMTAHRWLPGEELLVEAPLRALAGLPAPSASTRCYVQFSSGTSGAPKGVPLTHANILANLDAMAERLASGSEDVGVSWLPLHHDMGLLGGHLLPARCGMEHHLMRSMAFAARPWSWLERLGRARATLSVAPGFAFDLCLGENCLAKLSPGLRLDSLRAVLDGSEPIRPGSPQDFARALAPYGFPAGAVTPCYGLAEASLAVTIADPGEAPLVERVDRGRFQREGVPSPAVEESKDALEFVSVGRPLAGVRVAVPEDREGEILVAGDSVMGGYLDSASGDPFVRGPDGQTWLSTGDLGYMRGGLLYVTGRLKEILVCRGRNQDPLELEEAAEEVAGVRAGHTAAISFVDPAAGREVVVLLLEALETAGPELARAVRERVAETTGVVADRIELVPRGTIERTTSGKKRRAEARSRYLQTLEALQ